MNFFDHQERARRASRWLLFEFGLAVVVLILTLNLIAAVGFGYFLDRPTGWREWFFSPYWMWLSAALLILILFGSWRRLRQFWGHGDALAVQIGANNIAAGNSEPGGRRLLNVVEEMAIAAGLPAPSVWVLADEAGINAFVAGTRIDNVALVVTRGALDQLDRDQLQGVVAHEFSHIFHGDMRLNLQLTGILAGLENLSQAGIHMLRAGGRFGGRSLPALASAGLVLFLMGSMGWLCGRLIRAAFARQREYLADASAVQYTRNPHGIAGALAQIRDSKAGAVVFNRHIEALSHFCFALPLSGFASRWLASHPPLQARIDRIDRFHDLKQRARTLAPQAADAASGSAPVAPAMMNILGGAVDPSQVGALGLALAAQWLQALPANLAAAARSVEQAPELVVALLLDRQTEIRERQLDAVREFLPGASVARVETLRGVAGADLQALRLPLLEIAVPQLRRLQPQQLQQLRRALDAVCAADARLDLFELLVLTLVRQILDPPLARAVKYRRFADVGAELNQLLWGLIRLHPRDEPLDRDYHQRVMRGFLRELPPPPVTQTLSATDLQRIARRLDGLAPLLKPPVLQACRDCVVRDGQLTPAEAESLRVVTLLAGGPAADAGG